MISPLLVLVVLCILAAELAVLLGMIWGGLTECVMGENTQPCHPPDADDDAESHGLGPVVKPLPPEEEEPDDEVWTPLRDHPGFEVNRAGQWRTIDKPIGVPP